MAIGIFNAESGFDINNLATFQTMANILYLSDTPLIRTEWDSTITIDKTVEPHIISGTDATTGFSFVPAPYDGDLENNFNYLVVDYSTWATYVDNEIINTTGMDGNPTNALYIRYKQNDSGTSASSRVQYNFWAKQSSLLAFERQDEGYVKMKIKVNFGTNPSTSAWWINIFEWEGGNEFRRVIYISKSSFVNGGLPYWRLNYEDLNPRQYIWDEPSASGDPYTTVLEDTWMEVETYWKTSTSTDGIAWIKVDGVKVCEHIGINRKAEPHDFMNPIKVYGTTTGISVTYEDWEYRDTLPS